MAAAACVRRGFVAGDVDHQRFDPLKANVVRQIRRYLNVALRNKPDLDPDREDIEQEMAIAVFAALSGYDPRRGPLDRFLSATIRRSFSKCMRDAFRFKRMPTIEVTGEDGVTRRVRCPTISFTGTGSEAGHKSRREADFTAPASWVKSETPSPEEVTLSGDDAREHGVVLSMLRGLLNADQQKILDCYVNPSPVLFIVARNLSGGSAFFGPTEVALYLRMPLSKVTYHLKRIKKQALVVASQLGIEHAVDAEDV